VDVPSQAASGLVGTLSEPPPAGPRLVKAFACFFPAQNRRPQPLALIRTAWTREVAFRNEVDKRALILLLCEALSIHSSSSLIANTSRVFVRSFAERSFNISHRDYSDTPICITSAAQKRLPVSDGGSPPKPPPFSRPVPSLGRN
jgi:hypothetical protein